MPRPVALMSSRRLRSLLVLRAHPACPPVPRPADLHATPASPSPSPPRIDPDRTLQYEFTSAVFIYEPRATTLQGLTTIRAMAKAEAREAEGTTVLDYYYSVGRTRPSLKRIASLQFRGPLQAAELYSLIGEFTARQHAGLCTVK